MPLAELGEPIRGAGAAIVANMERSLTVPTATSFRNVPARLLEVNRKVINGYQARSGHGKVSFTHLIGYAVVRAIADAVPALNNAYVEGADGKPRIVRNEHVSMGLAVDVAKADGSRTLVVPVLRNADTMTFVRSSSPRTRSSSARSRRNKLQVDRLPGRHDHAHQPGHDRHGPVGAPTDARPGRHRRRRLDRLPGRVPGRRPRCARRDRACRRSSRSPAPTTTASSRAPSRGCS